MGSCQRYQKQLNPWLISNNRNFWQSDIADESDWINKLPLWKWTFTALTLWARIKRAIDQINANAPVC